MNRGDAAFADPLGAEAAKLFSLWDDIVERLNDAQRQYLDLLCEEYSPEIARLDGRLSRSSMMRLCNSLDLIDIPHPPGFLIAFRLYNWPLPFEVRR